MNLPLPDNVLKRIGITIALGVAFIVMASIFTPERSKAGDQRPARSSSARSAAARSEGAVALSADAHEGLRSLGVIESGRYVVAIFATNAGPRYTIFERQSQQELGTLLTPEQVQQLLPEVDLKSMDFTGQGDQQTLMLAEPRE